MNRQFGDYYIDPNNIASVGVTRETDFRPLPVIGLYVPTQTRVKAVTIRHHSGAVDMVGGESAQLFLEWWERNYQDYPQVVFAQFDGDDDQLSE